MKAILWIIILKSPVRQISFPWQEYIHYFSRSPLRAQANQVSEKIEEVFLKPGGLVTTPYNTGEQWDAPNGWAPLQWLAIQGLENYGYTELANEISSRWLKLNKDVYESHL